MKSHGASVELLPSGFVETYLGSAVALTRFHRRNGLKTGQRLLFYDSLVASMDHVRLLRLVATVPGSVAYDSGWGTAIDLDDPYYQSGQSDRPAAPRNAFGK